MGNPVVRHAEGLAFDQVQRDQKEPAQLLLQGVVAHAQRVLCHGGHAHVGIGHQLALAAAVVGFDDLVRRLQWRPQGVSADLHHGFEVGVVPTGQQSEQADHALSAQHGHPDGVTVFQHPHPGHDAGQGKENMGKILAHIGQHLAPFQLDQLQAHAGHDVLGQDGENFVLTNMVLEL